MGRYTSIKVFYKNRFVGYAGLVDKAKRGMFIYSDEWRKEGFDISPFALPLSDQRRIYVTKDNHPTGMFSVFTASLPGKWGSFLQQKFLGQMGIEDSSMNVLDRLALAGRSGRGALNYEPASLIGTDTYNLTLDETAAEILNMARTGKSDALGTLYTKGSMTGGSTPKIVETIDGEDWIIKFPVRPGEEEKRITEYEYMQCASKCGINVAETRLFGSSNGSSYFGVKCFDRIKNTEGVALPVHMLSVADIMEKNWRQPGYDYHDLMKMALVITKDNREDIEELFRRMCFNVFADNCNDHMGKFSFLYDEEAKRWRLAPAYGLRRTNAVIGARMLYVGGNSMIPSSEDIVNTGVRAGIPKEKCSQIAEEVETIVRENLKVNG